MKKPILTIAAVVFVTAITTNCNTSQQKVENAQENVADAAADLDKAHEEYLADVANYRLAIKEKIDENNKSISEFKARLAAEKRATKEDYVEKIKELELKNSDAQKRLDDFKEESKDKWESFKRDFNHDMDDLNQSVKNLTNNNNK